MNETYTNRCSTFSPSSIEEVQQVMREFEARRPKPEFNSIVVSRSTMENIRTSLLERRPHLEAPAFETDRIMGIPIFEEDTFAGRIALSLSRKVTHPVLMEAEGGNFVIVPLGKDGALLSWEEYSTWPRI